jgi:DNA-binding Xre family transcriptional regulator
VKRKNPHIGSSLDDLLAEDGVLEEVNAKAIKRVITWQVNQLMKKRKVTKRSMAHRMKTTRSTLYRLLDERDTGLTIDTLSRAANALGCTVRIELRAR